MRILITGIGNIGKSTLRDKIADKFPGKVLQIALSNIPIILKIVMKNILCHKKWVKEDLETIKNDFKDKTIIVKNMNKGYDEIVKLIVLNR